jgi:hypothetical protein
MLSSILQSIRLRKKPISKDGAPPSYEAISNNGSVQIQARKTPQWTWSNAQCREWLTAVMIDCFGSSTDEAAEVAKGWKGFGPNIYLMTCGSWKELLGEQRGVGLYTILLCVREKKGACPRNINLRHGGGRHVNRDNKATVK